VGSFAIQLAKSFGPQVTGVCSARNVQMVQSIGADHVIDYAREDFTKRGQRYDVIFDCIGNHSLTACRRVLNPVGILIMVGDQSGRGILGILARLLTAFVLLRFVSQRLVTFLAKPSKADLEIIRGLMEGGKIAPVMDRR
jgi:NADPH:quinone reductase-like Zn-dependent oxidoreductase